MEALNDVLCVLSSGLGAEDRIRKAVQRGRHSSGALGRIRDSAAGRRNGRADPGDSLGRGAKGQESIVFGGAGRQPLSPMARSQPK